LASHCTRIAQAGALTEHRFEAGAPHRARFVEPHPASRLGAPMQDSNFGLASAFRLALIQNSVCTSSASIVTGCGAFGRDKRGTFAGRRELTTTCIEHLQLEPGVDEVFMNTSKLASRSRDTRDDCSTAEE